jgi:4-amino-4-deoxy-L-arabinose transferase-like glycosyltransferase
MLLIPAILLVALFALLINSCFTLTGKVAYILGLFISAWANVILVLEILSLLRSITAYHYLLVQVLLVLVVYLIWVKRGKPSLWKPFEGFRIPALKADALQNPLLVVLGITVAAVYIVGAFLVIYVPPNNYDGMAYHLSRVGYWLQHQSTLPWQTPNPRQVMSPMNAELGILWTVLFRGTDQLAGYVQWTSALIGILVVFGLVRLARGSRSQSIFAALLFASLPQIMLQSTTVQNDLVVMSFFAVGMYFVIYTLVSGQQNGLIISGLALGLSIGTKATAVLMLPGMGIGLVIAWLILGRKSIPYWTRWLGYSLMGFILFGLFWMIQNYSFYRNPLGISELASPLVSSKISRLSRLPENILFYTNQFMDFTGLPQSLNQTLSKWKFKIFMKIFELSKIHVGDFANSNLTISWALKLPTSVNEDTSWFGPVAFIFILPAAIWQFLVSIRKKDWIKLVLLLLGISFLVVFSLFTPWTPYKGRYFILPAIFVVPMAAWLYGQKTLVNRSLTFLSAVLSIWIVTFAMINNSNKPLVGTNAIWGKDRLYLQTIPNAAMRPVFEMVEKDVPINATLATRFDIDHWDYPLFGKHFTRTIVQTNYMDTEINYDEIHESQVQFLLIAPNQRSFISVPSGFKFIDQVNGWFLLQVLPVDIAPELKPMDTEKIPGLEDSKHLVFIDPVLQERVGLVYIKTIAWGIEEFEGHGIYWIGEGGEQGISFDVWSEHDQSVNVTFELIPGPGRSDPHRRMTFLHYYDEQTRLYSQRIHTVEFELSRESSITFEVDLLAGMNELSINCLDSATVLRQPNGDERPLMVLLNRVEISSQP